MQQVNSLPNQAAPVVDNGLALKDIHLPEQITNYPIAFGWWLLATLVVLAIIFIAIKIRKTAKRNQVKKSALAQLKNNTNMTNTDIIALVKWSAMHYFSRAEIAKLFGHSLQQFLVSTLPSKYQQDFTTLSQHFFENQYHAENNKTQTDEMFHQAAMLWLTQALPPKPVLKNPENKNQKVSNNISQGANT